MKCSAWHQYRSIRSRRLGNSIVAVQDVLSTDGLQVKHRLRGHWGKASRPCRDSDCPGVAGGAIEPPGFEQVFDFNVYALCGDDCLMEAVSGEAAWLPEHMRRSNLCSIYDDNRITIEGNTALAFTEDCHAFYGYGWNVTRVGDANDLEMLARAFRTFQNTKIARH